MTAILTIDNGNTSPSVGTFDTHGNLSRIDPLQYVIATQDIHQYPTMLANVGQDIPELVGHPQLTQVGDLRTHNSFLDMPVHYSSTLGEDRLVCAWRIYRNTRERAVLIDAGTCVTIDLVDADGFQGGYILPGIQTFLDSYSAGAALPQLDGQQWTNSFGSIPRDTPDALLSSCHHYLTGTIQNILSSLHPIPCLYLTGGSARKLLPLLQDILSPATSLQHRPHLLHRALFDITGTTRVK